MSFDSGPRHERADDAEEPCAGPAASPQDREADRTTSASRDGLALDARTPPTDLRGRSVRGGVAIAVAEGAATVVNLAATAVLARLLLPADFGVVARVAPIVAFISLFGDLGLSAATIQRERLTAAQLSTLFWINAAVGALLFVASAGVAPLIAGFYRDPRAGWITIALATGFLPGGLSAQHGALLSRQLRFSALARISLVSTLVGALCGCAAAYAGLGYWALAVMSVASGFARAGQRWFAVRWIPGRPRRGTGVRGMLAFGGNLTGFELLNFFSRNADNVLIGKFVGEGPLGLYSMAYRLLTFPLSRAVWPLGQVVVPALSRLRGDRERYVRYYLEAIDLVLVVVAPVVVGVFVLADPLVRLVLGDRWLPSVPVFRLLAASGVVAPMFTSVGWLYLSSGATRTMMRWGMVATPLVVGSFAVGLPFGIAGVAGARSAMILILFLPGMAVACRAADVPLTAVLAKLVPPVASAGLAGAVAWGLLELCRLDASVGRLALGAGAGAFVYGVVLTYAFRHPAFRRFATWAGGRLRRAHRP